MTLQQSFNHRHKLSDLIRQDEGGTFKHEPNSGKGAIGLEEEDSSFERDSTHLNQQDSEEPTPLGLKIFGKKKSLNKSNLVAPFDPDEHNKQQKRPSSKKVKTTGNRYKNEILDDDFSRDISGEENIGIGDDEDDQNNQANLKNQILFDDEDMYGTQQAKKPNNRSKMLLDELDNGGVHDTDMSMRQQTMMEDETGALNSKRGMVQPAYVSPSKRGKNNPLTRSAALPNSSSKEGSLGDRSNRSNGGGGILGLSGINIDFRKSGNGIRSFFAKNGVNNQGSGTNVSKSIQFTQLEKR